MSDSDLDAYGWDDVAGWDDLPGPDEPGEAYWDYVRSHSRLTDLRVRLTCPECGRYAAAAIDTEWGDTVFLTRAGGFIEWDPDLLRFDVGTCLGCGAHLRSPRATLLRRTVAAARVVGQAKRLPLALVH